MRRARGVRQQPAKNVYEILNGARRGESNRLGHVLVVFVTLLSHDLDKNYQKIVCFTEKTFYSILAIFAQVLERFYRKM